MAHATVQRVTAFVPLEADPEVELDAARRRAAAGDRCWLQWLQDYVSGGAVIVRVTVVVEALVGGVSRQLRMRMPPAWLEFTLDPPLIEAQIQEMVTATVARMGADLPGGGPLGMDGMYVHVELGQGLVDRIRDGSTTETISRPPG